jgi:hypothetical protein
MAAAKGAAVTDVDREGKTALWDEIGGLQDRLEAEVMIISDEEAEEGRVVAGEAGVGGRGCARVWRRRRREGGTMAAAGGGGESLREGRYPPAEPPATSRGGGVGWLSSRSSVFFFWHVSQLRLDVVDSNRE